MNKYLKLPIVALICNLLLVYVLFTLTRLVFVWCNSSLYADHMSASYLMHLMLAGLRFDTTAILYLNCWMIVVFLLPLHWKENNQKVFSACRWLYVTGNHKIGKSYLLITFANGLIVCLSRCPKV